MAESDSVASVSPARYPAPFSGAVAQLGERLGRIEEVVGSSPICSIWTPGGAEFCRAKFAGLELQGFT